MVEILENTQATDININLLITIMFVFVIFLKLLFTFLRLCTSVPSVNWQAKLTAS